MTWRARRRDRRRRRVAGALAVVALAWFSGPPAGAGPLGATGVRAFDEARSADEAATAALDEGERALGRLRELAADAGARAEALRPHLDEAEAAREALTGYRGLAQAASAEALKLVAEATRAGSGPAPDPVRRETLEQHALLAAREAAVMAARSRAEAERLRAVLAEAQVAAAGPAAGRRGAGRGPGPEAPPADAGQVETPNLVGARLDAATRELEAAGLRLGPASGPREGFVVKQAPEAGRRVPRQTEVSVVLSATAATITAPR